MKICGVTRPEDALAAAQAGADAIGIVFYAKVMRYVPAERAREILAALPPFVTPVGLFVDATADEVRAVAGGLGLRHVQLHGRESAETIGQLREFIVLKALRVAPATIESDLEQWRSDIRSHGLSNLRGFVMETASAGVGGTGVENDWSAIAALQREGAFDGLPAIIAAGGLRPETVGDVVRTIRPFAVDVSSGVEEETNQKSAAKIERFIAEVAAADADR